MSDLKKSPNKNSQRVRQDASEHPAQSGVSRRDFLKSSAATAAIVATAGLVGCDDDDDDTESSTSLTAFDAQAVTLDPNQFRLGVQAGEMKTDSAILWTYQESAQARRLRVWKESATVGQVEILFDADVAPFSHKYLKQKVEGLQPFTEYHYAFFEMSGDQFVRRSRIGRFKTAPAAGESPVLRVSCGTCSYTGYWPDTSIPLFSVLSDMAQQNTDLFLQLGDLSYNDGAFTTQEFRDKWFETLDTDGYRDILANTGFYTCWDDHEVDDNWDPETTPQAKIDSAFDAFYENVAMERLPQDRFWRSHRWGDTMEIFILDCRSERLPSTYNTPDAQYMSPEQFDWLKDGLKNSPCHFKVVLNSVPMTKMGVIFALGQSDNWNGYEVQRTQLLDYIDLEEITNIWFLSGDFHVGFVARLDEQPTPGQPALRNETWEIAVGPTQYDNPLTYTIPPFGLNDPNFLYPQDRFDFYQGDLCSTYLTFDPGSDSVRIEFVKNTGEVLYDKTLTQNWTKS